MRKFSVAALTISVISACSIFTLSQSGGTFAIQKSVIAGGGRSAGGTFLLDGTSGQSAAGTTSLGGAFQLSGGFWGGPAVTVSNVTISGRVYAPDALTGLRNTTVTLTDPLGTVRNATTSSFGLYAFDNVMPGTVYTIRILSRRFRYQARAVQPSSDLTNIDFVGLE